MKKRSQEIVYGYLFTLPIIVGVILFTLYPMVTSFWYSLTSYNPLDVQKNSLSVNLQEEMDIQLGVTPETLTDLDAFARGFDVVAFLCDKLSISLDETQRAILRVEFHTGRFGADLKAGKLNVIGDAVTQFKSYLRHRADEVFPNYAPTFIGGKNFVRMLTGDQYFWIVLGNTFLFALVVVVCQTFIAVVLAVAANSRTPGVGAFKLIYFIPAITSSSAISMIFWMLYAKPGVFNQLLGLVGIGPVDWLNDPATALPAVMVLNIWTTAGFFMITFLAGLQNIPAELYEAADMDGANPLQVFWRITWPMLRPQIVYVMIMGTIGCMQVFDQVYYLLGSSSSGTGNMRNGTMAFYIYKNGFFYGEMGYASAIALVLFAIILGITILQRRFIKESLV